MAPMKKQRVKQMIFASWALAGFVFLLCVADLVAKVPFNGSIVFDILFLLSAIIVGYLGWDAYSDLPA